MKALKWTKIFLFGLTVSALLPVNNGLNYAGCHRFREICRSHVRCDYRALYQSCGHFMTSRFFDINEEDPIPPISLVKAWLFFPEALNQYKEGKNRHLEYLKNKAYHDKPAYLTDDSSNDRVFQDEVIERVRRFLHHYAEAGLVGRATHDESKAENDFERKSFKIGKNTGRFGNYKDWDTDSTLQKKKYGNSHVANNWNDGLDIKVKKSNEIGGDYDVFHLLKQEADYAEGDQESVTQPLQKQAFGQKDNVRPRFELDTDIQKSEEMLSSEDLNNHNKEHLTIRPKAAASPYDFIAKKDANSPSVVVNNKQEPKAARETSVAEESSKDKHFYPAELKDARDLEQDLAADPEKGTLTLTFSEKVKPESLKRISRQVQKTLWGIDANKQTIITKASVDSQNSRKIHLRMHVPHSQYSSEFNPTIVANKINTEEPLRNKLSSATGLNLLHARSAAGASYKLPKVEDWDEFAIITAIVGGCTLALIVSSLIICSIKRRNSGKIPVELHKKEAITDYEELCRTQMALNAASPGKVKALNADKQRHGLVNGQGKYTRKTWREEPHAYNMDISTGHVILAYMEEHLQNEDKLSQEWEALCNYKADQDEASVGDDSKNVSKNRYSNVLPYDHSRVKLRETANVFHSDYINANFITDSDPRSPAYIATQGPLDNTIADFWQMIWEQGVVVIVNLTRLSDMGLPQCQRYWPDEGSEVYNTYQVHLISEHIWCDDYIVRSFYLKHLATQETRTITQFHYLTWPDLSVPESPKPLLEFRRKVNKCYRGQACPIVVHCNNGVGRTGTYILIDMVLKKMIKGTKEIDIAATLEYLRDQRPDMVKTKAQFEFSLSAVAEEVTAILSSLSS